ncbi:putative spermidine/putrescine transport system substrate-binding protein [Salinihabitans flavidus]|uniref:Putative spermidine/putrescine transport system substrate-binding protein n=1 Tax=Salinihabitans flavidus TaxID=569882 RepID=A0A1H8VPM6_9RHOB|nr:extracellular solute-binding protein [Salinihabitans flavidus]SEP17319.1 putative spermidine/putrescine transport system substrate-binding protein [Salinihabitans flavidus]
MPRFSLVLLALLLGAPLGAQDLAVATWGGAYEAAQRKSIFTPYTEATGQAVTAVQYDGTVAALRARAGHEGWDVIDMLSDQARVACAEGLLLPLDAQALARGPDAMEDFSPHAATRCAMPQNVYARVLAYDERAFPGVKPTRIEGFFDTARFPGKRAVQRGPDGILEWALLAEGVPPEQVYGLLSTDRGLRLAFRKLDSIRDDIVWWNDPAEPAHMLAERRAVMAEGFNGRFFDMAARGAAPVDIVWDGRIIGTEVWAIPATTDRAQAARDFLSFALRPSSMARFSELIPYGPTRRSAFAQIGLNPATGVPMRVHLPNAPQHGGRALIRDSAWNANTRDLRQRRFEAWLKQDE